MLLVELVKMLFVLGLIVPQLGGLRVERRIVVRLAQQRLDGQQDGAHVVEGRPLLLQDVQANGAAQINVGVKARRNKFDVGRAVGIRVGELYQ